MTQPWAGSRDRSSLHDDARGHEMAIRGCVLHREWDTRGDLINRYWRAGFIHDSRLFCHDVLNRSWICIRSHDKCFRVRNKLRESASRRGHSCCLRPRFRATGTNSCREQGCAHFFNVRLHTKDSCRSTGVVLSVNGARPSNRGAADIKPTTQPCATVARRADRRGSATSRLKRCGNWGKGFARQAS